MSVMQQLGRIYHMAQCKVPPRLDGKTLFGLHLYLAERCSKISQVPGALRNVNPLVGVIIYCTIF